MQNPQFRLVGNIPFLTRVAHWSFGGLVLIASIGCESASQQGQALAQEPIGPQRVEQLLQEGKGEEAIKLLDKAVEASPKAAGIRHARACTYFRIAKITEAMKDFDEVYEMSPASRAEDWQRGIALYYAKRYEDGVKQFELHRTVNPNDVENSVWHFLCVAKVSGVEEARKILIPSAGDPRPPLMDVLKMFRGDLKPEEVAKAAESVRGSERTQATARFYGYLYLGLYFEALDQTTEADQWLQKCLDQKVGGYMRDVAEVHLKLRQAAK